MPGTLTISTLSDGTNSTSATNPILGSARAWVRASVSGITPTVQSSFNVSSVTYNSTGDYTISFTNALPNANYSFSGCAGQVATSNVGTWVSPYTSPTTTAFRFETSTWSSTRVLIDVTIISFAFFSS